MSGSLRLDLISLCNKVFVARFLNGADNCCENKKLCKLMTCDRSIQVGDFNLLNPIGLGTDYPRDLLFSPGAYHLR